MFGAWFRSSVPELELVPELLPELVPETAAGAGEKRTRLESPSERGGEAGSIDTLRRNTGRPRPLEDCEPSEFRRRRIARLARSDASKRPARSRAGSAAQGAEQVLGAAWSVTVGRDAWRPSRLQFFHEEQCRRPVSCGSGRSGKPGGQGSRRVSRSASRRRTTSASLPARGSSGVSRSVGRHGNGRSNSPRRRNPDNSTRTGAFRAAGGNGLRTRAPRLLRAPAPPPRGRPTRPGFRDSVQARAERRHTRGRPGLERSALTPSRIGRRVERPRGRGGARPERADRRGVFVGRPVVDAARRRIRAPCDRRSGSTRLRRTLVLTGRRHRATAG